MSLLNQASLCFLFDSLNNYFVLTLVLKRYAKYYFEVRSVNRGDGILSDTPLDNATAELIEVNFLLHNLDHEFLLTLSTGEIKQA